MQHHIDAPLSDHEVQGGSQACFLGPLGACRLQDPPAFTGPAGLKSSPQPRVRSDAGVGIGMKICANHRTIIISWSRGAFLGISLHFVYFCWLIIGLNWLIHTLELLFILFSAN